MIYQPPAAFRLSRGIGELQSALAEDVDPVFDPTRGQPAKAAPRPGVTPDEKATC